MRSATSPSPSDTQPPRPNDTPASSSAMPPTLDHDSNAMVAMTDGSSSTQQQQRTTSSPDNVVAATTTTTANTAGGGGGTSTTIAAGGWATTQQDAASGGMAVMTTSGAATDARDENWKKFDKSVSGTRSVLHMAAETGDIDKVKEILSECRDTAIRSGADPLKSVSEMINRPDEHGQYAIHYASVFGKPLTLELLAANGADVNIITSHQTSAMHYAARNGQIGCINVLTKYGARVNVRDVDAWTPLHFAVFRGHLKTAQVLLSLGAAVDAPTQQGHTPLHLACNKGHMEIASLLVQNGSMACLSMKNSTGLTPLASIILTSLRDIATVDNFPSPTDSVLSEIFRKNLYPDITLAFSDGNLTANKCILAARCMGFSQLFQASPNLTMIPMPETTVATGKLFLEWIYTGYIVSLETNQDFNTFVPLLSVSNKLNLPELKELVLVYLCHYARNNLSVVPSLLDRLQGNFAQNLLLCVDLAMLCIQNPNELGYQHLCKLKPEDLASVLAALPIKTQLVPTLNTTQPPSAGLHTPTPERAAPKARHRRDHHASQGRSPVEQHPEAVQSPTASTTDAKALRNCKSIINSLRKHKLASVFNQPVNPQRDGAPDYFEVIKKPMDLGTIKEKLETGMYNEVRDFVEDVQQVWKNACMYNVPGTEIHQWSLDLRAFFEKKLAASHLEMNSPLKASVVSPPTLPGVAAIAVEQSSTRKRPGAKLPIIPLTLEEKRELGDKINLLQPEQITHVLELLNTRQPIGDEDLELDLDTYNDAQLREVEAYIDSCLQATNKRRRQ
ncbi:bromodomain domain protein [Pelomyxa schiedti]|nr:bromodomain domain protein [Pelomyxa schiedti]